VTSFFFSSRRRHTRFSRDWSSACALPISLPIPAELGTWHRDRHAPLPTWVPGAEVSARGRAGEGTAGQAVARALSKAARRGSLRSEERRVGKDGWCESAPDQYPDK